MSVQQGREERDGKGVQHPQRPKKSFRCCSCNRVVHYCEDQIPAIALCPKCMEVELGMSYDPEGG